MKNIHVISTPNPSRIISSNKEFTLLKNYTTDKRCKNSYITSNEEIKRIDYWLNIDNNTISNGEMFELANDAPSCKKIILTTDQELIKDGVQTIDDDFLEWFVKNSSCEEVEIEKTFIDTITGKPIRNWSEYKIIIPKEEPKQELRGIPAGTINMVIGKPKQETLEQIDQNNPVTRGSTALVYKQETLEEVAERLAIESVSKNLPFSIVDFTNGYKLAQERSYSEVELFINEVKDKIDSFEYSVNQKSYISEYLDKLFEEFKKK
jgi:hypothetical protein